MHQKILVTLAVFVVLLLLAHWFMKSSTSTPLGFGHPSSHADVTEPDEERQKLEEKAALASQQAATVKKFKNDNYIA